MTRRAVILVGLVAVNIACAIAVVEAKQKTRDAFHQLQVERVKRDHLRTEWAQLRLEDSTWASPERIGQLARAQLNMVQPKRYVVLGEDP
jgi:cell division protein FtsL